MADRYDPLRIETRTELSPALIGVPLNSNIVPG